MKKKLLISLSAMLVLAGSVFAWAEGETAEGWWEKYGDVLKISAKSLTSSSITAQKYINIKEAVEAYNRLAENSSDLAEVIDLDDCTYDDDGLFAQALTLDSKNKSAATSAVNAMKDQINGMTAADKKAADRSDLEELQNKLANEDKDDENVAQWGAVKAEFADFAAAYDNLVAKVADALLYVTADEWVVKVDGYAFDKTAYATQKSVVEGFQTEGEALVKQTDDVKAALTKIAGWLKEYDAQAEEDKQVADREAFYTALDKLSGKNFEYTLTQEDVDDAATASDYVILKNLSDAWNYLSNNNSEDKETWKPATAGIKNSEIALAQDMLVEFEAMTAALTYLQDDKNLYYDTTPTTCVVSEEQNDYENIMSVKAALAEDATTPGKKYINQLYTSTKIDTNWENAKTAFIAWDLAKMKAEAVQAYQTTYARVLDAEFENTTADYYAGTTEKKTVRDALDAIKNYSVEDLACYDYYRNGHNNVASEKWAVDKDAIVTHVTTTLAAKKTALKGLVKDAAVLELSGILRTKANAIYNAAKAPFVVAEGESFTADQALTLKNSLQALTDAQKQYGYIGTANYKETAEDGTVTTPTNFTYTVWDEANDEYVIFNTTKIADVTAVYPSITDYKTQCWGYTDVVAPFKAAANKDGLFNGEFSAQNADFRAMKDAAKFLDDKKALIWYDVDGTETLNEDGVGVTNALKALAVAVKAGNDDIDPETNAKYAGAKQPYSKLSAAAQTYIVPVYNVLWSNCEIATGDDETFVTGDVMVYAGTKAGTDKSDLTSWKAICALATEATTPNTLVYVNKVLKDEDGNEVPVPTNVIVRNADNTGWRATAIDLTDGENFYVEADVEVETITLHKSFGSARTTTATVNAPMYFPFNVTLGELKAAFGENCIVRYLNTVYEKQAVDEETNELIRDEEGNVVYNLFMNFHRKAEDTDVCHAFMPYTLQADKSVTAKDLVVTDKTLKSTPYTNSARTTIKEGSVQSLTAMTQLMVTLQGVSQNTKFNSAAATTPTSTANEYWYMKKSTGGWQQVPYGENDDLNGGRLLLLLEKKQNVQYIIRNNFTDDNEETGIETVNVEKSVEGIHTINGVKVENMKQPGLYIVNGKKVMVK